MHNSIPNIDISENDFFNLIEKNNLEMLSTAIKLNHDLVDAQHSETGLSAIFFAIKFNKIDVLKLLLEFEEGLLDSKNKEGYNPIFYAISQNNAKAVLAILNKSPNELSRENCVDEENPLNFAINNTKSESLNAILDFSKSNDIAQQFDLEISERIFFKVLKKFCEFENVYKLQDDLLSVLNLLYKTIFDSETELTESQTKNIKVFFENFMLINLAIFGNLGTKEVFFRNLLDKLIIQSDDSKDFFQTLQLELDKHINDFSSPIVINDKKFYVFDSDLSDHSSFFIFHVDLENKIEAITYIDGSQADSQVNSDGYVLGAKTFKLNQKLDFTKDLFENFMAQLDEKNAEYIRNQLNSITIGEQKFSDLSQDQSILTKNQDRGNCIFKSNMILLRFFAENSINSQISESLQDEYREYKTQLKIQAFENLFRLRDSLDNRSNLDNFLLRQIEDVVENSKIKLLEKISTKTSPKELKILDKILATIDDKKIHKVEKRKSIDPELSTPISKKTLSMSGGDLEKILPDLSPKPTPKTELKEKLESTISPHPGSRNPTILDFSPNSGAQI
jgi:hypothetical protein